MNPTTENKPFLPRNTHDISTQHWLYPGSSTDQSITHLQEPGPFEDFKYHFDLDNQFMPYTFDASISMQSDDTAAVLDDADHQAFSQFLDTFIQDLPFSSAVPDDAVLPRCLPLSPTTSSVLSSLPSLPSLDNPDPHAVHGNSSQATSGTRIHHHNSTNMGVQDNADMTSISVNTALHNDPPSNDIVCPRDVEQRRQSSILQSLDMEKWRLHQRLATTVSTATLPTLETPTPVESSKKRQTSTATGNKSAQSAKRNKPSRDLLTEEEKRANHIASEQKRRGVIRDGFQNLADIVPTLKHVNNSKGAVIFRAVEYIRYLEKRNKSLFDKAQALESRVRFEITPTVPGKVVDKPSATLPLTESTMVVPVPALPPTASSATTALMAHKTQQQQLQDLQEKLQFHQRRLQRQETTDNDSHRTLHTIDDFRKRKLSPHKDPDEELLQHVLFV